MKRTKISMLALAAVALCACTSEDLVVTDGASGAFGGDGYISLAINLPMTASTRAANDIYDDGLASEYNVNDAYLLLFDGKGEEDATCYDIISLGSGAANYDPANDNITARKQYTKKITGPVNSLYALVVVNARGVISSPTSIESAMFGTTALKGASLDKLQNTAITMDVSTIANVSGGTNQAGNFYMTNAPLWKGTKGGYTVPTGEVTTLAYIDETKIYNSQAEAEANPATEVYVERGVAKVTVNGAYAESGIAGIATVTVDGFVLDLTNLTGYPVRNSTLDATSPEWNWDYASTSAKGSANVTQPYRMVGGTEVGADLYRTYWAIDPNYDSYPYKTVDGTDPNYSSVEGNRDYTGIMTSLAGNAPTGTALTVADGKTGAYCLENTFNVAHQNQDETTRAIVAVTLKVQGADSDGSFYTLEGDKSILYTEEQICNKVISLFAANGDVQAAEKLWKGASTSDDLYSHFTASIDKSQGATDALVSITASGLEDSYFTDGVVPEVFTTGLATVVAQINADNEFSYYAGGVAYYPVLIKHFGDDLTPWIIDDAVDGDSYPGNDAEANWLGRYGVLRNNWYDITVTTVNDIGSADVPTAYGEQDDPTQKWMSFDINILSWAKRMQEVEL